MNMFGKKDFSAPRFLDDIARVAGGAVNILSGVGQQAKEEAKSRLEDVAQRLDLVPRADLDRAEAAIEKLRARVDALEKRLTAQEGSRTGVKAKAAPPAKTTPKGKTKATSARKKKA